MLNISLKKLEKFAALNARQKIILAQAWFMLGWTRAVILTTSFKRVAKSLEHHRTLPDSQALNTEQQVQAADIGKLVASAARYTPWQSLCLVQVLVVQRLLARYRIPGQFHLGVRRVGESKTEPGAMSAHAWLQCDGEIVNGRAGHEQFTVVSTFSWDGRMAE